MALPTPSKTWRFCVNQSFATSGVAATDFKQNLLAIKQALCNQGSFTSWTDSAGSAATAPPPWSVVGSSNGSAVVNPGDNWTTTADINYNSSANARSWIVLANTNFHANFQVCFDIVSSNTTNYPNIYIGTEGGAAGGAGAGGFFVSQATAFDFSSATTSARPRSTTLETQIWNRNVFDAAGGQVTARASWIGYASNTNTFSTKIHAMRSTDGKCNRIIICSGGYVMSMFILDEPTNPVVISGGNTWNGSGVPWYGGFLGSTSSTDRTADACNWYTASSVGCWGTTASLATRLGRAASITDNLATSVFLGVESSSIAAVAASSLNAYFGGYGVDSINEISSEYPIYPIALWSKTVNRRGRLGTATDIWGGNAALLDGDAYPGDGTRQFVQLGDFVFPWNRSAIQLT